MQIKEIAETINKKAKDYKMGTFNQIRKDLHSNLTRLPPKKIFISPHTITKYYAFHYGGRNELQFNIGFPKVNRKLFRYGVALSLRESQALPDYTVLDKQFLRLSEFMKVNKSKLSGYKLYYDNDINNIRERMIFLPIGEINPELFAEGVFIFLGKIIPQEEIDYDDILSTFDDLLEAYKYAEGKGELIEIDTTTDGEFTFEPKISERVEKALRSHKASKTEVDLRHNQIQGRVALLLVQKYGKDTAGTENHTGFGTNIDIVVKKNFELIFYEIKTSDSIRLCLREAIGQLLEYAYWSEKTKPTKLIVISENQITVEAQKYLQKLRNDFGLNLYYQHFDFDENTLSSLY